MAEAGRTRWLTIACLCCLSFSTVVEPIHPNHIESASWISDAPSTVTRPSDSAGRRFQSPSPEPPFWAGGGSIGPLSHDAVGFSSIPM